MVSMVKRTNKYHTTIGEEGQTILWRGTVRIANYKDGIAKLWIKPYAQHKGIALVDEVWKFLITEGNNIIRILSRPDIVRCEISIEHAKKVIIRNAIGPNRVEEVFQHLIKLSEFTPVTVGLYGSKAHS